MRMANDIIDGGCQCGSVRYRITGSPVLAAMCHWSMCRRANAAPAVAWAMYQESQVTFLNDSLEYYASSPGASRGFCPRCGTQISFTGDDLPGLIDITIGSFDDPSLVSPQLHYW